MTYTGPMVLQCKACRRIIGDTLAYVASDAKLDLIALASITENATVQMVR